MKNLLVVFTFLSSICIAQTTKPVKTFPIVEKAVFDTINSYRVKNGLKKVIWCDKAYKSAYHHSYYLSDVDSVPISHYETIQVLNLEKLEHLDDRLRKYVGHVSPYGVENIVNCNFSDWWFKRKDFDAVQNATRCIFKVWRESTGHNYNMLNRKVTHGAIAIVRELDGSYCRVVMVFYKGSKG